MFPSVLIIFNRDLRTLALGQKIQSQVLKFYVWQGRFFIYEVNPQCKAGFFFSPAANLEYLTSNLSAITPEILTFKWFILFQSKQVEVTYSATHVTLHENAIFTFFFN